MRRHGRFYLAGIAEGSALVLAEPVSFWGGVAVDSGTIIDKSHPDCGRCVSGRVLVMPGGRGSSSSSSVLAELLRCGLGPAAIILARPDPILTVGCLVADSLYGRLCPLVVCPIDAIRDGTWLRVSRTQDGEALVDAALRPDQR